MEKKQLLRKFLFFKSVADKKEKHEEEPLKSFYDSVLQQSSTAINAQNIAINSTGTAANLSSMLDISSGSGNNLGLLIPTNKKFKLL